MTVDDPAAIETALERLVSLQPAPAAARLSRRPGQKEARYAHLLGGTAVLDVVFNEHDESHVARPSDSGDRVAALEALVEEIKQEMASLRAQFVTFREQFE